MTSCYAMHEWASAYRTPKSVRRRSSRVDFQLRNPNSADVVLVIKALFSIFDPHNRVETNMYFVFTHVSVLALRYLHFFFVANLYYRLHEICQKEDIKTPEVISGRFLMGLHHEDNIGRARIFVIGNLPEMTSF